MRRLLAILPLALAAAMAVALPTGPHRRAAAQTAPAAEHTGNVIVRFQSDASLADVADALSASDTAPIKTTTLNDIALVQPEPGQSVESAIADLEADSDVLYAEPDYVVTADLAPNDTTYGSQWHYPQIGLPTAWDTTTGDASIIVAVVDTGVELTDAELDSKITSGGNAGYDFANSDADPTDDHGHGTHVAGTIAAETNNSAGVAGVCWACKIMPVKALDSTGSGSTLDVAAGIDWARTHGAQVVNLSLGSLGDSVTLHNAVDNAHAAGVVVVGASGNNAGDADTTDDTVMYPGAYPNAIGVGATDSTDTIAYFSNYGPEIDVVAPGVSILSTVMGAGYQSWSGTSMATPHVAGVVGLMMAAGITDPTAIRTKLTATATDLGPAGFDNNYGYGRINAHLAVDASVPAPAITTPVDAAVVSGTVSVAATASDSNGIASVKFWSDATLLATDTSSPYSTNWDTTTWGDGAHSVKAESIDSAGNLNTHIISVTVNNADVTPPTVSITSPAPGTVSGSVVIDATAADNVAVSKVRFWAGPTYLGYDTTAPYSKTWNTASGLNGKFSLKAEAVDLSNNKTSTTIIVTVINPDSTPPAVSITSPVNSAGVIGTLTINASASDTQGLQKVQFWAGSTYLGYDTTAPYSKPWDSTLVADGPYTIKARAVDWANNMTETTITVTAGNNDVTPPTASITDPLDGATVSGTITVSATGSDNVGLAKIRFWVDGTYLGYDSTSPYTRTWDSASVANGPHTIKVQSVDLKNNVSSDVTITIDVSN